MIRLLFVDDEPMILSGLRRLLRPMRNEWEMTFAGSGEEALRMLEAQAFDVIVSDVRMPGMDGIRLLSEVHDRRPNMIRIALSGHTDHYDLMLATGVVHQFLAKPAEPEVLKRAVSRSANLRKRVKGEALLSVIAGIESIPSLPAAYREVREEMMNGDPSLDKVGAIVARDSGMAAKVLQLVNSSFFGIRRDITDPGQAVVLLGLDTFMALVLSVHLFEEFKTDGESGPSVERLWRDSHRAALIAKAIAVEEGLSKRQCEDSYLAGLVHNVGRLLIAANLPREFAQIEAAAPELGLLDAEREVLGCDHQDIGGYLIGLWGLPDAIVEAVSMHHAPSAAEGRELGALATLHAAAAFTGGESGDFALDATYIEETGASDRIDAWRRLSLRYVDEEPPR